MRSPDAPPKCGNGGAFVAITDEQLDDHLPADDTNIELFTDGSRRRAAPSGSTALR